MVGIIIGNQNPLLGTTYNYEIKPFGLSFGPKSKYEWYLYKKQKNGTWKDITGSPKTGEKVTYRFGEPGLGIEFEMKVYETKQGILPGMPSSKQLAGSMKLIPTSNTVPKIEKVVLFNRGARDVNKASYRDTLIAQAHCIGMFNKDIEFHLWEDDAPGKGHNSTINKNNRHTRTYTARVNEKGIAEIGIPLMSDERVLRQMANKLLMKGDQNEGANHEYYVTASYSGKIMGASQTNVDVANPDHKTGQQPTQPKSQPQTNTPKFPTGQGGGPRQPDPKGNIIEAVFVDSSGKELSKVAVGNKVHVRIHSKNMVGKYIQYVIWEYDMGSNDEVYRSGNIKIPADLCDTMGFVITKDIFKKGVDSFIPNDPDQKTQNYFIEIISKDLAAESKKFGVSSEGLLTVENPLSPSGVQNTPKPEQSADGKCPNCEKPVTADDLKTIFPNASEANRKIVAETYTKYMKDLGMNTCSNKAHFFAQARVEAGDALNLKEGEGFNYYWESIIGTFKAFQTKEGREKAKLWGRAIRDRKDPKAVDVPIETQIKIANYAYSPPAAKAKELENTEPNDGWNYRGRGLIQVTGKGFYKYCNPYTLKYNNVDVLKNPDAIGERIDLCVSSGMIFFKWKKINELANKTRDVKGKICPLVGNDVIRNGVSKNHQPKQDAFDTITSKVFKIDQCTINNNKSTPQANGKWRMPIDNPMLCLYSQGGGPKPWHGSFGEKIRDGSANHTGCDLLAVPGTKVYACFKGKINKIYTSGSMAGNVVVIEVLDKETFKSLQNKSYQPTYKNKGEILERGFNHNGTIYLTFWHLSKNDFFKEGDPVEYNDVIGLTGISGWGGKNFTTRNPHLHFEVSNVGSAPGLNGKCNPAMYFHFKTENELSKNEIDFQNKLKEKEWK